MGLATVIHWQALPRREKVHTICMNDGVHPIRLVLKALGIFVILNAAFAGLHPQIGRLSIFNKVVSGRARLPAVNPAGQDFRIGDVDALFSAHVISGTVKSPGEYRVLLLGNSQTWGWLVPPSQTVAEYLNQRDWAGCHQNIRFYNLAYPFPSALRDFFYLHEALPYKPDMVIWMVTLESFSPRPIDQLLLDVDPTVRFGLLPAYGLQRYQPLIGRPLEFADSTLMGQGSHLKSLVVLQLYGIIWDATGIDNRPSEPLTDSTVGSQSSAQPRATSSSPKDLTFDVLQAGQTMLNGVPILVVNEPIPVSADPALRYNSIPVRQSYDQYQQRLRAYTSSATIPYRDFYDQIPASEFPAGNLHLTARGEKELAKLLAGEVAQIACP